MKITFIMFSNALNGGNRVIGLVASELVARGHDVEIFKLPHKKPRLKAVLRNYIQHGEGLRKRVDGPFLDRIMDRVTTLETRRPVRDADLPDADVVIATWWETAPWVNALSSRKGAKAYFMQDYGAPGQELDALIPTWKMPFTFITLNRRLQAMIKAQNLDAPVAIMSNAVDHSLFNAPPRVRGMPPTIGLLYRGKQSKGMDIAAKALTRIRQEIPGVKVVAVGNNKKQLPDWVDLVEKPDDQTLIEIYRSCDLWLFPSRMEGFGLPIIEAMACRTPVISTRVGGAEDVITDGVNGCLVDIDDWNTMATRAIDVLNGPTGDWLKMSQAAHEAVSGHTWSDAVDVFEAALGQAAAMRP
ncbi:MAG: glycosyltransferase family 4 protein [Tateyamaria sp.]|uniref:glycosyltransferase family 4 protein n=1 Tax=Tateyamaria sp. TaxID=1929288 RepID=UPI003268B30E